MDGSPIILTIILEANPIVSDRRSVLHLLETFILDSTFELWTSKEANVQSIKFEAPDVDVAVWCTDSVPPHLDVVVLSFSIQAERYSFCPHQVSFLRRFYNILHITKEHSYAGCIVEEGVCWQRHLHNFGAGVSFGFPPSEVITFE